MESLAAHSATEVLTVIDSLPSLKELRVKSPRTTAVKAAVGSVLQCCKLQQNQQKVRVFAVKLTKTIFSCFETALSKQKEKMWKEFGRLPELYLLSIGCDEVKQEPLFMELVNETMFEKMTKAKYESASHEEPVRPPSLTNDEENIIRYICGYVGMKLHERFVKQHGKKAAEFVECIDSMNVKGPPSCLRNGSLK